MKYYIEKFYPCVLSAILTFLFCVFGKRVNLVDLKDIVPVISPNALSFSSIMVGFLLTVLAVLSTINSRRMDFVKKMGKYPDLIRFISLAIKVNLAVTILSFCREFVIWKDLECNKSRIIGIAFLFILLLSILLTVRFMLIFIKLLADKKSGDL